MSSIPVENSCLSPTTPVRSLASYPNETKPPSHLISGREKGNPEAGLSYFHYPSTLASSCTFTAPIRSTSAFTASMSCIVTPAPPPFGRPCFFTTAVAFPSIVQPHASWLCLAAWIGLPHLGQGFVGKDRFLAMVISLVVLLALVRRNRTLATERIKQEMRRR